MKFPFVEAYFQALCQFQGGFMYLVPSGGLGCAKHDQGAIMQRMMGVAALPCVWRTFAFGMHTQMIDVEKTSERVFANDSWAHAAILCTPSLEFMTDAELSGAFQNSCKINRWSLFWRLRGCNWRLGALSSVSCFGDVQHGGFGWWVHVWIEWSIRQEAWWMLFLD